MNLQFLDESKGDYFCLVDYLKVSTSYFPLVLCVISKLKCIIHQNFGKLDFWMRISFIILFMIDLYKDNHVCACMRL